MADEESRGIHLSDKQLVFIFMAATVAAVIVFLFGVLVGRGVQQARGPVAEGDPAAAQVVPDATPAEAPVADGMARQAGAAGADQYSYPARLGKTPPAEQLRPLSATPGADAPRESPPPEVPAEPIEPSPKTPPAPVARPNASSTSAPRPAATGPESQGLAATGTAAPGTTAPGMPAPPPPAASAALYTVQVAAVKDRQEADGIVKRLKAKGYDAYVFVPESGDSAGVFRVRIGSFKDRRQADMLAERLLREEKRYKPWVTR